MPDKYEVIYIHGRLHHWLTRLSYPVHRVLFWHYCPYIAPYRAFSKKFCPKTGACKGKCMHA